MIIKQTLDSYAASLNKTFQHRSARRRSAAVLEAYQCARKTFWTKNEHDKGYAGVERDPEYKDTWGARMRGTVFEDAFWEPALRARFGDRLLFAGKSQKTFFSNFLSATPDGMIVDLTDDEKAAIGTDADCVMAECKTADPRTNLTVAKPENVYQTHVQMGLVRESDLRTGRRISVLVLLHGRLVLERRERVRDRVRPIDL